MKIELKPGVSPAAFWTAIAIGLAGTATTALSLTSYAWAGGAILIIGTITALVKKGGSTPPAP